MDAHLQNSIRGAHEAVEARAADIAGMSYAELLHRFAVAHQHRAELLEIVERLRPAESND